MQIARDCYRAYEAGDRSLIEKHLAEDFTFYSPADVGIDRARYFERCWPNAERIKAFDFKRLVEAGDEVIVTYESTKLDGHRFRNTEILTFEGDKVCKVEVYFGWDLEWSLRRRRLFGASSRRRGSNARQVAPVCLSSPFNASEKFSNGPLCVILGVFLLPFDCNLEYPC
ncbi:MAG: nuclear transport factor 2 family protein [Candidatus Eremiobacteraeota bacterium]|nr:nuclear transport factor 2 family protein [Candidatus Eremiobacteraeota bacterium]